MDRLGVDVKNISPRSSASFKITVGDMGDYTYFYDEFKIGWRSPKDGGWYYDMFDHPLAGQITEDDVDRFPLPDPLDPARFVGLREMAIRVRDVEQRAVVIGQHLGRHLRTADLAARLRGRLRRLGIQLPGRAQADGPRPARCSWPTGRRRWRMVGDVIDVAQIADDVAGQQGLLISPRSYRKLLKPLHKELCDYIHARTERQDLHALVRRDPRDHPRPDRDRRGHHQPGAGERGGHGLGRAQGASSARTSPSGAAAWTPSACFGTGTPDEVRDDVQRRSHDFMPGGGFVFNTVHNIQGNVPAENIMAMWETVQEYGVYGK